MTPIDWIALLSFILMLMTAYIVYKTYQQNNELFAAALRNKNENESCGSTNDCKQGLVCQGATAGKGGKCSKSSGVGFASNKQAQTTPVNQATAQKCNRMCTTNADCDAVICTKCHQNRCTK